MEYPDINGTFNGNPTDPEQYRISTTDEAAFSNPDNTFIYAGWDAPDEVIAPWTCTNSPINPLVVLNPDVPDTVDTWDVHVPVENIDTTGFPRM